MIQTVLAIFAIVFPYMAYRRVIMSLHAELDGALMCMGRYAYLQQRDTCDWKEEYADNVDETDRIIFKIAYATYPLGTQISKVIRQEEITRLRNIRSCVAETFSVDSEEMPVYTTFSDYTSNTGNHEFIKRALGVKKVQQPRTQQPRKKK